MITTVTPTRMIAGQWHVKAKAGWRPVRNPMIAAILDAWPDAVVTIETPEPEEPDDA